MKTDQLLLICSIFLVLVSVNRSCSVKGKIDEETGIVCSKLDSLSKNVSSLSMDNELLRLEMSKMETETMRNSILLDASINESNSLRVKAYDSQIEAYNQKIKYLKTQIENKNGKTK